MVWAQDPAPNLWGCFSGTYNKGLRVAKTRGPRSPCAVSQDNTEILSTTVHKTKRRPEQWTLATGTSRCNSHLSSDAWSTLDAFQKQSQIKALPAALRRRLSEAKNTKKAEYYGNPVAVTFIKTLKTINHSPMQLANYVCMRACVVSMCGLARDTGPEVLQILGNCPINSASLSPASPLTTVQLQQKDKQEGLGKKKKRTDIIS